MPASCDISWASKTMELGATEEQRKMMTFFCKKLHTASREEIDAECAERAAKASNQEEHFAISASGTWSTAVDVRVFNISGESSCNSQRLGNVEGILCMVGEVLRGELFVPGVFHCRGFPLIWRTTSLRLLSVLVKSQSMVHEPLGLLYKWPLEM